MKAAVKNLKHTDFGIYDPNTLDQLRDDEIHLWGSCIVYADWIPTIQVSDEDLETFGCSYPVDSKIVPGAQHTHHNQVWPTPKTKESLQANGIKT